MYGAPQFGGSGGVLSSLGRGETVLGFQNSEPVKALEVHSLDSSDKWTRLVFIHYIWTLIA